MSKGPKIIVKEYLDGDEIDLSLQTLTTSTLPVKELATLKKGKKLDLSKNQIVRLPDGFVSSMVHLVKLDLSGNGLLELPKDFGSLQLLQHVDLFNNQLSHLPITFYKLKILKWLDVKDNPLTFPPDQIVGLCRNAEECKYAATQVLQFMKKENNEREKARQQELTAKRAQKEALKKELERLEELEILETKRIKQEEKMREKSRRRAQYEAKIKEEKKNVKVEEKSPQKRQKKKVEAREGPGRGVLKIAMMVLLLIGCSLLFIDPSIRAHITKLSGVLQDNFRTVLSALNVYLQLLNKQLGTTAPALHKSVNSAGLLLNQMLVICNDTVHLGYTLALQEYRALSTYIQKSYL